MTTREDAGAPDASGIRLALFTDTYFPHVSGAARALARLVEGIGARGGLVRVVTVEDPRASFDRRVLRLPATPLWLYPQFRVAAPARRVARRVIEEFRPTVVHAATPFGIGLGARAAALSTGTPLVTSYHTHFPAYLSHYKLDALISLSWPFLRWFHNSGLVTYAPSASIGDDLALRGFQNTRIWSRGVDADVFNPEFRSRTMRAGFGAGDEDIVVLYVGRIAPEKGVDVAIDAMSRVMHVRTRRVIFAIVGEGPFEREARATAPSGTIFTGPLFGRDLSEAYASADILLFPSRTETFGNVVLEAMASGVAVVAPDRGATAEFAQAGTAIPCDVSNAGTIASCIERLLCDRALRQSIASAGLRLARTRSWESIVDKMVLDYLQVARSVAAAA